MADTTCLGCMEPGTEKCEVCDQWVCDDCLRIGRICNVCFCDMDMWVKYLSAKWIPVLEKQIMDRVVRRLRAMAGWQQRGRVYMWGYGHRALLDAARKIGSKP